MPSPGSFHRFAFDPLPRAGRRGIPVFMRGINADLLAQLPLNEVTKVTFYKRDELTIDLICCEVSIAGRTWAFHEEMEGWDLLIDHLQSLPGFRSDWFAAISQPAFATNETLAFSRC